MKRTTKWGQNNQRKVHKREPWKRNWAKTQGNYTKKTLKELSHSVLSTSRLHYNLNNSIWCGIGCREQWSFSTNSSFTPETSILDISEWNNSHRGGLEQPLVSVLNTSTLFKMPALQGRVKPDSFLILAVDWTLHKQGYSYFLLWRKCSMPKYEKSYWRTSYPLDHSSKQKKSNR